MLNNIMLQMFFLTLLDVFCPTWVIKAEDLVIHVGRSSLKQRWHPVILASVTCFVLLYRWAWAVACSSWFFWWILVTLTYFFHSSNMLQWLLKYVKYHEISISWCPWPIFQTFSVVNSQKRMTSGYGEQQEQQEWQCQLIILSLPLPKCFQIHTGKTTCCLCLFPGFCRRVLNRFLVALIEQNRGKALDVYSIWRWSQLFLLHVHHINSHFPYFGGKVSTSFHPTPTQQRKTARPGSSFKARCNNFCASR